MNTVVKVTREMNINQVVKEAYEWALKHNQMGLMDSYEFASLRVPDLKSGSQSACEEELFILHSGAGTPDGSWKTVVQRADGRISAVLATDDAEIFADIMYMDGEFRLMRWHF